MTSSGDAHHEVAAVSSEPGSPRPADPADSPPTKQEKNPDRNASPARVEAGRDTDQQSDARSMERWFRGIILALGAATVVSGLLFEAFGPETNNSVRYFPLVFGLVLISMATRPFKRAVFDRQADDIRDRIEAREPPFIINATDQAYVRVDSVGSDVSMIRTSESLQKQEKILREMYTQGLAQAKISFFVSIIAAVAGAGLLMWGIFLAISNAPTPDGQKYASLVAVCAGIVTNVLSSIFFIQSNRARRDMAQQGLLLREESQEDRRLAAARELVGGIQTDDLRDMVRAHLSMTLLSVDPDENQKNRLEAISLSMHEDPNE
ncbi:hypothetical protein [Nocardia sp. NPDC059691]|uniref:TRADD-N-associated membrane domain-containing protein n=1 Tax=Nocardia sp. NPDC059691 TaxID=3346908 RepID=UPI0036A15AA7